MIGPLRRWLQNGVQVSSALVLMLALLALTLVQSRVESSVASVLDNNWRGAYDILVTRSGQDFGGANTRGLVDANFVATAGDRGISLAQLDTIRRISDVDVAAPIGMVGVLRGLAPSPQLDIVDDPTTRDSPLPAGPTAYRITSWVERSTDLGPQVLAESTGVVALRQLKEADVSAMQNGQLGVSAPMPAMGDSNASSPQISNEGYKVQLGALPGFASAIIAVDPDAEAKLLGGHGSFLEPLRNFPTDRTARALGAGALASVMTDNRFFVQQMNISDAADDPAREMDPAVPLLVNTTSPADITLHVKIERSTADLAEIPQTSEKLKSIVGAARFDDWRAVSKDISEAVVPFSSPDLTIGWPGNPRSSDGSSLFAQAATELRPALVDRPHYSTGGPAAEAPNDPAFVVRPLAIVGADGLPVPPGPTTEMGNVTDVGHVRAYRDLREVTGGGFTAALPAPVGEFSSNDLAFDFNRTSYVPLGAYDPAATTLIGPAQGVDAKAGTAISPGLSAVDFITPQPGAITDLAGGAALRGTAPIDAIRVRVAGIGSYDAAGVRRIESVAKQITAMGLNATVVAGSSPQPVAVYVPEYFVGGDHQAGDLGWVSQDWTTLGAAVAVRSAFTALQWWVMLLGLVGAGAGAVVASALGGRNRRVEVSLLRQMGWTEHRIRRRVIADQVPGVLLVCAAAAASAALADNPIARPAAACAMFAVLLAWWSAVRVAMRTATPRDSVGGGDGFIGPWSLATHEIRASPGSAALRLAGVVLLAAAGSGLAAAIIVAGRGPGGPDSRC